MYTHERGKGSTLAIPISGDGTKKRPTEDKKNGGAGEEEAEGDCGVKGAGSLNEQGVVHSKTLAVNVAQSCPTLCDPMEYTVPGILLARILEWVAFSFSRRSSLSLL